MKPFPALTLCLVTACAPAVSPSGIISPISTPTVTTSLPTASAARGALFAQANWSSCHALGPTGASPLPAAPPLREISRHRDVNHGFASSLNGETVDHALSVPYPPHAAEIRI